MKKSFSLLREDLTKSLSPYSKKLLEALSPKALLEYISQFGNFLFFAGFAIGRAQNLPIGTIGAHVLNSISLGCYLFGYLIWLLNSELADKHARMRRKWYGFAGVSDQDKMSAMVGIIATLLCFITIFVPYIAIPAMWLFFASNLIWSIAQYHRVHNPMAHGENFSTSREKTYFWYTFFIMLQSLVNAIGVTIMVIFPPSIGITFFVSIGITTLINIVAYRFWLSYHLGIHPKDKDFYPDSYRTMGAQLNPENTPAELDKKLTDDMDLKEVFYQKAMWSRPQLLGKENHEFEYDDSNLLTV